MTAMNHAPHAADVAVIGGGPAGALCAIELARAGLQVVLFNRSSRHSASIELVSGTARRALEHFLAPNLLSTIGGVAIDQTIALWNTEAPTTWSAICNPHGAGIAVDRVRFDEKLRSLAADSDVKVLNYSRVRTVARRCGIWEVLSNGDACLHVLKARLLVVAAGAFNVNPIRRTENKHWPHIAIMAHIRGCATQTNDALYLEQAKSSWWYMLPDTRGGHFVGQCLRRDLARSQKKPLSAAFLQQLRRTRLLSTVLPEAVPHRPLLIRPAGPRYHDQAAGEAWIAIGDAAFVPDPLSGLGLDFAIRSAQHAAHALLSSSLAIALREYNDSVREFAFRHTKLSASYHHLR